MAKTNVIKNTVGKGAPRKKKNVLLIVAAITVIVALVLGIVLGIIIFISSRRAVMEYEGIRMDEKVASYLISVYKPEHIANLKKEGITYAEDTAQFWDRENPDGSGTFGEGLVRSAEKYLKEILVGVYLYDQNAELSDKTEAAIEKSAAQVAEYYYGTEGFDALFEADAQKMGYDYKSYVKAAVMLYKYSAASSAVYGSDGAGASYFPSECNEFLKLAYSHVQLAFVRTKTTFKLDADGNRVQTEGGYELEDISDAQERERADKIATVKTMMDNYKNGVSGEVVITSATVEALAKDYKSDQSVSRIEKGYYFSPNSDYTKSFLEEYKTDLARIVDVIYSLELDGSGRAFGYCDLTLGSIDGTESVTCFIYKSEPVKNAYADSELSDFFTDFYADAANLYLHPKDVTARTADVKVKKKFYEMPIAAIPQNNIHKIRQFLEEE